MRYHLHTSGENTPNIIDSLISMGLKNYDSLVKVIETRDQSELCETRNFNWTAYTRMRIAVFIDISF